MKSILIAAFSLLFVTANAQFGKDILGRVKESAKQKTNDKIDQKSNAGLDKALNTPDSVLSKKQQKKAAKKAAKAEKEAAKNAAVAIPTGNENLFTGDRYTTEQLVYSATDYSFDESSETELLDISASLKKELNSKKTILRIYKKDAKDKAEDAKLEAVQLMNKLAGSGVDKKSIFIDIAKAPKKTTSGNRQIVFILVPDTFTVADMGKYK